VIILDTNVLSETMRPAPEGAVLQWLDGLDAEEVHTTAITSGELLFGVEQLPAGRRRSRLAVSVHRLLYDTLADRVVPYDLEAAAELAAVVTARNRAGRPIDVPDAQIAAICRSRAARLATRNVGDFEGTGVEVVNPWEMG
jgi:toxin FitB